jgi:signal peptidase
MCAKRWLIVSVEASVFLTVCSLVVGQLLGYPVLLGFVETGSMAPTLNPGDGFVAIPAALAGPVGPGDVVTFRAAELNGGGLTTHRVVEETDGGYVTRGDANPFTDQSGEEPPVKDAQIVAVALQVGGSVVVIPELGTAVEGIRSVLSSIQRTLAAALGTRSLLGPAGLGYVIAALAAGGYVLDLLVGTDRGRDRDRQRSRDRDTGTDVRLVLVAFALVLVAGATAAMVVPAGTQEYGLVSAEFESERPTVVPAGETGRLPYAVGNGGSLPIVAYVEPASEGVAVGPERLRVPPGGTAETTVVLQAPPETGYYRRFVVEHRYLAVLPTPVVDALHDIHPWAPIVAIDAVLGGGLYLVGRALVGSGQVRRRRNSRDRPDDGGGPLARLFGS